MEKKQRFVYLAMLHLERIETSDEQRLQLADCLLNIPGRYVPDHLSYHDLVLNFVEYFLNESTESCLNYPDLCLYIDRWKKTWTHEGRNKPVRELDETLFD